jgi:DNA-binding Lrp family transcriptional regulator
MDTLRESDLELVDALQVNPRANWSTVGKVLGVSALTVARRWSALSAAGVAWSGSTMGPALFRGMFVELSCRPGTAEQIVARLCAMPEVITVGRTAGEYDLYAIVVAPTPLAMSSVLWTRLDALDVARKRVVAYTRVYGGPEWRLTVLNRSQTEQIRDPAYRPQRRSPVTPADRSLFHALTADARRSYADLATELTSTPHAVRRQLERMRRSGELTLRADISRPIAGWPYAALLHLAVPEDQLPTVGQGIADRPETRFCAAVLGAGTMVWVVNVRSPEQVEEVTIDLHRRFPAVVVLERSLVLHLAKVNGRLLDRQGRSTGIVPVDPWLFDQPAGTRDPHSS